MRGCVGDARNYDRPGFVGRSSASHCRLQQCRQAVVGGVLEHRARRFGGGRLRKQRRRLLRSGERRSGRCGLSILAPEQAHDEAAHLVFLVERIRLGFGLGEVRTLELYAERTIWIRILGEQREATFWPSSEQQVAEAGGKVRAHVGSRDQVLIGPAIPRCQRAPAAILLEPHAYACALHGAVPAAACQQPEAGQRHRVHEALLNAGEQTLRLVVFKVAK